MTDVFLDTVGLIGVWDRTDQWHAAADAVYRELLSRGRRLVTTEMVLLECGNAAARRPYRSRVSALRQSLIEDGLLVAPALDEIEAAWAAYDRGEVDDAGIVDQISFGVMRRLGLSEVFTNDQHFRAAGFTPLF
jgi:predicted nucleic acid-binding protein